MSFLSAPYCYCEGTKKENALAHNFGYGLTGYYSYKTPVAYTFGGELVIRVNEWGPTTGRHMNAISTNKNIRIPGEDFEYRLANLIDIFKNGGIQ